MIFKSFYHLGTKLNKCFNCKYCRARFDNYENQILPTQINPLFKNIPVAINLCYGDPLLQINNTVNYLKKLESSNHKGIVIIITKGNIKQFPKEQFNLNIHFAFSTFGKNHFYDGGNIYTFLNNLEEAKKRKYNFSIEYRPICYNINDDEKTIYFVLNQANKYNIPIGYCGLQGKPDCINYWKEKRYNFISYPNYTFGHKKIISNEIENKIQTISKKLNINIFKKTSCLLSFAHNLNRDYNAHYYRPNEVGCFDCPMKVRCNSFYKNLFEQKLNIPFEYDIIYKEKHECILKTKGLCEFPTKDCSNINGYIIKIFETITTADVRLIKWLYGYTVDANFYESTKMSDKWIIS